MKYLGRVGNGIGQRRGSHQLSQEYDYPTPAEIMINSSPSEHWKSELLAMVSPSTIESDQGADFTGKIIQDSAKDQSIMRNFHLPYNPVAFGSIERYNGLLKQKLRLLTNHLDMKAWTNVIQ